MNNNPWTCVCGEDVTEENKPIHEEHENRFDDWNDYLIALESRNLRPFVSYKNERF
jgi:hypothetical protein